MKYYSRRSGSCIINKFQDVEPIQPVADQKTKQKRKKRIKEFSLKKSGKSMSFRSISRNTYYRLNSVRDPPPPCGYYNINHQSVDKSSPKKEMILRHSLSK